MMVSSVGSGKLGSGWILEVKPTGLVLLCWAWSSHSWCYRSGFHAAANSRELFCSYVNRSEFIMRQKEVRVRKFHSDWCPTLFFVLVSPCSHSFPFFKLNYCLFIVELWQFFIIFLVLDPYQIHSLWNDTPSLGLSLHFFSLHCTACGVSVPWPGTEPRPSTVERVESNHWTAREVPPRQSFLKNIFKIHLFLAMVGLCCCIRAFLQLQWVGPTLPCGVRGLVVVVHGLSCSKACGIFPSQGLNWCPLRYKADFSPLDLQGRCPPRRPIPSWFLLIFIPISSEVWVLNFIPSQDSFGYSGPLAFPFKL